MKRPVVYIFTTLLVALIFVGCTDKVHESMRQWSLSSKQSLAYQDQLFDEVKNDVPYERMKLMQRYASYRQNLVDLRDSLEQGSSTGIQNFKDDELDRINIIEQDEQRRLNRNRDQYLREYGRSVNDSLPELMDTFMRDSLSLGERHNLVLQAEIELVNTTLRTFY